MASVVSRFKKDPLGFIKRTIYKTTIGLIKYGRAGDYDAANYWRDRFAKYGKSIKGPGDEGLSEEENKAMYAEAAKVFMALCRKTGIDFPSAAVLEIGCGTGFYAQVLKGAGVGSYTGLDITDVLFDELKKRFPSFRFIKTDITSAMAEGTYDVVIMIDVMQHIVSDEKLTAAMENVKRCLKKNGVFILSSIKEVGKKRLFYVRSWTLAEVRQRFPGYSFGDLVPFRDSTLIAIRKN
jgi:2-polyprenyl-3-methyl-5-hydroxy-6-metoxy-1,4-benzoquinol methylase